MHTKKTQYEFLNLLKCIAIIFVIVYHSKSLIYDIRDLNNVFIYYLVSIFSTSVPIFFLVNGALLLNKDLNIKKHIKRTLKILLLTFIWSVLTLLILEPIKGNLSKNEFIYSIFHFKLEWNNHLWFMISLLYIYILFPIIKYIYDKVPKIIYIILLLLFTFVFGKVFIIQITNIYNYLNNKVVVTYNVNRKLFPFVYFILGGILFKYKENFSDIFSTKFSKLFLYMLILINMLLSTCYGIMFSKSNNIYYDTVWNGLVTLTTFFSCISIYILALEYKGTNKFNKFINFIGTNTLGLYFTHWIYAKNLKVIFKKFNIVGTESLSLLSSLLIIIISILTVKIMKKIPIVRKLIL